MLRQLEDAATGASRGETPILAISSDLQGTEAVERLRNVIRSRGLSVEIVFIPESQIASTSARLVGD